MATKTISSGMIVAAVVMTIVLSSGLLTAQEDAGQAKPNSEPAADPAPAEDDLAVEQARLADRYKRLELIIDRLAELSATKDPRRAAVLRQVFQQSKEQEIELRFESLVGMLEDDRLALATKNQENVKVDLERLLEVLLKEDRANRIEEERRRIRRLLKEVGQIIKEQRGVKARTEGNDDLDRLQDAQGKVTEKTGRLADELSKAQQGEGGKDQKGEPKEQDAKDPDKDAKNADKDGKAKENNSQEEGKAQDGKSEPGDGKSEKGKEGPPQDAKGQQQSQGQQSQDGSGEQGNQQHQEEQQQQPEDQVPKRVEAARQKMKQAEERLKKAERSGAVEEQQKALEQLEQAKAELEKILRQLREEEIERMLTMLDARFRKMLEKQIEIYEGTQHLDKIAEADRGREHLIHAGRLSRDEALLVREADKALTLLHDEGSSSAFPETVGQMRDDMEQVVVRLAQAKTDVITQGLEEDIIASLEEMIDALKKALKELEQKKQPQGKPQEGMQQDPALVDMLAELRMIRALQMRVNKRTQTYSDLIEGEQAERPELLKALERLAEREARIHNVTRDISLGRNR